MSVEANKENIRRHVDEIWHKGDLSVVDELIAPNFVGHSPEDDISGIEGFKQMVTSQRTAMPDIHFTIDSMVTEGDWVAVRYTSTGTLTGEAGGIAPTGKQFKIIAAIFYRFEGGKQVEAWIYMNMLAFYQQVGVAPPSQ